MEEKQKMLISYNDRYNDTIEIEMMWHKHYDYYNILIFIK